MLHAADHYGGLSKHFAAGTIYCSSITAALVHARLGVPRRFLRVLPLDTPVSVAGIAVTLLSANHCPGAVMFLFDCPPPAGVGSRRYRYLHVGDFRWHRSMMRWPLLRGVAQAVLADSVSASGGGGFAGGFSSIGASLFGGPGAAALTAGAPSIMPAAGAGAGAGAGSAEAPKLAPPKGRLDALYLDTTYCEPSHAFPPQEACVAAVRQTALAFASDPGCLMLFGAYTIGKERVFMEVARALNERIYVDATRYRTLSLLEWPLEDRARLTSDPSAARIHVVPMGYLSLGRLHERLRGIREAAEAAMSARIDVAFAAQATAAVAGSSSSSSNGPAATPAGPNARLALAAVPAAVNALPSAAALQVASAAATPEPFTTALGIAMPAGAATAFSTSTATTATVSALGIAMPRTERDFTGARRSLGFNKFVGVKSSGKGAIGASGAGIAAGVSAGSLAVGIAAVAATADAALDGVDDENAEPSITGVGSKRPLSAATGRGGRGRGGRGGGGRGRGKAIGSSYFERIAQLGAAQAHAQATGAAAAGHHSDAAAAVDGFGAAFGGGSNDGDGGGILSVFEPSDKPSARANSSAGGGSGNFGTGIGSASGSHGGTRFRSDGSRYGGRGDAGSDRDDDASEDDGGDGDEFAGGGGFLPDDRDDAPWSQDVGVGRIGSIGSTHGGSGAGGSTGALSLSLAPTRAATTTATLAAPAHLRGASTGQAAAAGGRAAGAAGTTASGLPPLSRRYGPFHSIVAFKPTGWAYAPAAAGKPTYGSSSSGSGGNAGSDAGHHGRGEAGQPQQPGDTFQLVDIAARIAADTLEAEARREWEERQRQRQQRLQGLGISSSSSSSSSAAAHHGISFNAMDRREGAEDLALPGAGAGGLRASGAAGAALDAAPTAIDDIVDARRPAAVAERVYVDDAAALPLANGASAPLQASSAAAGVGLSSSTTGRAAAAGITPGTAAATAAGITGAGGLALSSRVVTVRMTKQTRAGGARIHPGGALAAATPAAAAGTAGAAGAATAASVGPGATPAAGLASRAASAAAAPGSAAGAGAAAAARGPVPEPPSPALCMLARQLCVPVAALQSFMQAPAAAGARVTPAAAGQRAAAAAGTGAGAAAASTPAAAGAVDASRRRKLPPGGVTLFSVPYSEHSSFDELRECVAFLDPLAIVPTVNCRSAADAARIVRLLKAADPTAAAAGDAHADD